MDSPGRSSGDVQLRGVAVTDGAALRRRARWMVWLRWVMVVMALGYALVAGLKTVVDFDLGWQMAAGRYLLAHHAVPRTEVFSYTARGVEWIYPVLSGVVFYLLYQMGGYGAISWFCALSCVGCAAILVYRRGVWAAGLGVLAVPVLASEVMPRASLFTMLLFAAVARVLLEQYEGRWAPLWMLPVMMLLWVNLHPGFVAGLALMLAYVVVEALELPFAERRAAALSRLRRAWPWLVGAAVATVLNPWGWRIFVALSRQMEATRWQSAFVEEWAPVQMTNALQELGWRTPESAQWWLLGLGVALAIVCLWRRRIGPGLVLLVAAFAFVRHMRMEGPFVLLVCLIGGSVLERVEGARIFAWRGGVVAVGVVALLAGLVGVRCFDLVTDRTYLSEGEITLFGSGASWWLPEKAADFVLRSRLPGNVFSNFNLSSYLVWRLGEAYPDFADGRYIPFDQGLFDEQRRLTALPLDSEEWTRAAERYGIHTVIFPVSRIFALGEFPLKADCQSKAWVPVYLDTAAIVFVRRGAAPVAAVDCSTVDLVVESSGGGRAARFQRLANASAIYSALGRFAEARDAAGRAEGIFAHDPTLAFVKAQTALGERRYDEAEDELREGLKIKETDAGWYNLALLYVSERKLADAAEALRRSARFSREDYARYLLMGRVELAGQQPQEALDAFAQAERRGPYDAGNASGSNEFRAQVAEARALAFMEMQEPQRAVEFQDLAVQLSPGNAARRRVLGEDCAAAGMDCGGR